MNNRDNALYFGIGLGVGAAVAMLMAPRSGEEMRQHLSEGVDQGVDRLKRQTEGLRNTVMEKVQQTKETVAKAEKAMQYHAANVSAAVQGAKDAYRESAATTPPL